MRRAIRESNRRQEILRRVFVVEFIGGKRNELRHRQVRAVGRTGEDHIGTGGGEGQISGGKTGKRIFSGDDWRAGPDQRSQGRLIRRLIVGDGPDGEIEIQRGEEAPFIVIAALDNWEVVELPGS